MFSTNYAVETDLNSLNTDKFVALFIVVWLHAFFNNYFCILWYIFTIKTPRSHDMVRLALFVSVMRCSVLMKIALWLRPETLESDPGN